MPSHLRFNEGNSDYDPSDSDEDYTENEKILLNRVRNRQNKDSDSEGEVFGVGSGSEDSDQSDIALSDVEGQEDKDNLPDVRAWGTDKRKFYSTDYVDPDYGGFQGKDAHLAELEEEEARNLQQQLAQQLDDDDFSLDIPSKPVEEHQEHMEIIKSDISKLTKRQKLQILEKESPEFFGLVEDFQSKMKIVKDFLCPVLQKHKNGTIPDSQCVDFVQTQYELILNYCINISMYLLLKASRINVQNHPVIKRLYQHRQLLSQLLPVYEEVVKPQIEVLLTEENQCKAEEFTKKALNVLQKLREKYKINTKKSKAKEIDEEKPRKRVRYILEEVEDDEAEDETTDTVEVKDVKSTDTEIEKRAITYQIAKNKGLTPHRKKEQRNPRVKHRNKFRKAKIRRKGAVREPRTELKRYGGEISGIKTTVTKSIKIKT